MIDRCCSPTPAAVMRCFTAMQLAIVPLLLVLSLSLIAVPAHGENTSSDVPVESEVAGEQAVDGATDNLSSIQTAIEQKRNNIKELSAQLKKLEDVAEKQQIETRIERLRNEIAGLQQSFEHIALGGINLSLLTEQPEVKIDWREEIEQVSRPLLSTLKELTAKPRQIDSLRRDIERRQEQLAVVERALESLQFFQSSSLPPVATGSIEQLQEEWQQRLDDIQRSLEIAEFKLASISTETVPWYTTSGKAIGEFFRGRGLTLLLAVSISLLIWLITRGLLRLYWRWLRRKSAGGAIRQAPLIYYSHRLLTAILIVLAVLIVFYVRGDVLFLTLALVALVGAALTLRQTLPRYTAELRLLLGIGPVRERERLQLDGIPYLVESLSVYTILRNPALDGLLRLPLHTMNDMVSRPATKEPWFPCQPGDYLLMADGNLGRVLRQSVELVEILVLDSVLQISTQDFLSQNNRNLSRQGYGLVGSFGIDYQHQAICLDEVPARLREVIVERFRAAGLADDIADIIVEFKEAAASSLDYRIYLTLRGTAAAAFFKAQRLIQQACVDACNREGWVIPFTQITVHTSPAESPGEPVSAKAVADVL